MPIELPAGCPRHRTDCEALARVEADDHSSLICMGENDGTTRTWPADRFRLCVISGQSIDTMHDLDSRDVADQISVMAQAMSVVANRDGDQATLDA